MDQRTSLTCGLSVLSLLSYMVFAGDPKAARVPPGTPQDLQLAEQLLKQERWAEARAAFDRAGRAFPDCHASEARQAVRGGVACSLQLDDWAGAWERIRQFRQRETAQPDDRHAWNRWHQETPEAKASRHAVAHFEFVRELLVQLADHLAAHPRDATAQRRKELTAEQIELNFTLVHYIVGPSFDPNSSWRQDIEWWWDDNDHLPLGADGQPRFVRAPTRYTPQIGPGAKVLYLLNEVEQLDTTPGRDQAARALLQRAQIARLLYGPSSDPGWDGAEFYYAFDQRPSFLKSYRGGAVKPFWELADNEARTLVAGRVGVIELPEAESPLALLRLVERKYPHSSSVAEAVYIRGLYYQSRQQFARALDEYRALQKAYPQHPRSRAGQKRIDAILHSDVLLGTTGFYPAGSKPSLWFAHRQTNRVEFVAQPFDLPRFLREEAKVKADPWRLRSFGMNLLPSGRWGDQEESKKHLVPYLGTQSVLWSETVPKAERVTTQATQAPLMEVGAYLVEARVPGRQQPSRALVVLTNLVLVYKQVAQKSLLYVADAQTGRAVAGQEVHFYGEKDSKPHETAGTTNQDGVIEKLLESDYEMVALAFSPKGGVWLNAAPGTRRPKSDSR